VQDLFRRVLETASAVNVDRQRNRVPADNELLFPARDRGGLPRGLPQMDDGSMTESDRIGERALLSKFAAEMLAQSGGEDDRDHAPLVRSEIAREQHQRLAEADYL